MGRYRCSLIWGQCHPARHGALYGSISPLDGPRYPATWIPIDVLSGWVLRYPTGTILCDDVVSVAGALAYYWLANPDVCRLIAADETIDHDLYGAAWRPVIGSGGKFMGLRVWCGESVVTVAGRSSWLERERKGLSDEAWFRSGKLGGMAISPAGRAWQHLVATEPCGHLVDHIGGSVSRETLLRRAYRAGVSIARPGRYDQSVYGADISSAYPALFAASQLSVGPGVEFAGRPLDHGYWIVTADISVPRGAADWALRAAADQIVGDGGRAWLTDGGWRQVVISRDDWILLAPIADDVVWRGGVHWPVSHCRHVSAAVTGAYNIRATSRYGFTRAWQKGWLNSLVGSVGKGGRWHDWQLRYSAATFEWAAVRIQLLRPELGERPVGVAIMVTSRQRRRMIQVLRRMREEDVMYVATDGIWATAPIPVRAWRGLGGWRLMSGRRMTVWAQNCRAIDTDGGPDVAVAGVPCEAFADRDYDSIVNDVIEYRVRTPEFVPYGIFFEEGRGIFDPHLEI